MIHYARFVITPRWWNPIFWLYAVFCFIAVIPSIAVIDLIKKYIDGCKEFVMFYKENSKKVYSIRKKSYLPIGWDKYFIGDGQIGELKKYYRWAGKVGKSEITEITKSDYNKGRFNRRF